MELLLDKNEMINLGNQLAGVDIGCREGHCWITQAGDPRDHILAPGMSMSVRRNGQLVLTATEQCRVRVILPQKNFTRAIQKILAPVVSIPRVT